MMDVLWRWWCLWWVCLAAVTLLTPPTLTTPTPTPPAEQQGQCEVLDSSLQSTFHLPTNLTLKPTTREWQVDFGLHHQGQASPAACVCMEQDLSSVRLMLYRGSCKEGVVVDYTFMNHVSVLPHTWTFFTVNVNNNTVLVTGPASETVKLSDDTLRLTLDALHVTATHNVQVAVGCHGKCPYKRFSSDQDKKKTIMESSHDEVLLFFRPGQAFVKLQYEVTCTTWLGLTRQPHITDIVLPPNLSWDTWHLLELFCGGGVAEVTLNYEALQHQELPYQCDFKTHAIRVMGDCLLSACDPSGGQATWTEKHTQSDNTRNFIIKNDVILALIAVIVILIAAVLVSVVMMVRYRRLSRRKSRRYARQQPKQKQCNKPLVKI